MQKLVIIDPGHGGSNFGTCNAGLVEKEITLALGVELMQSLLPAHLCALRLTRDSDSTLSLGERGNLSRDADFVLSIHVNANHNSKAHGITCYYWPGNMVGRTISRTIIDAAPSALRTLTEPIEAYDDPNDAKDDWMQAPKAVLSVHRPTTVLAEVGFSSNLSDREMLLTPIGRSAAVCALRAGICSFLALTN